MTGKYPEAEMHASLFFFRDAPQVQCAAFFFFFFLFITRVQDTYGEATMCSDSVHLILENQYND